MSFVSWRVTFLPYYLLPYRIPIACLLRNGFYLRNIRYLQQARRLYIPPCFNWIRSTWISDSGLKNPATLRTIARAKRAPKRRFFLSMFARIDLPSKEYNQKGWLFFPLMTGAAFSSSPESRSTNLSPEERRGA